MARHSERYTPCGGKGVNLVQEYKAARDGISCLEDVCKLLLALAIPLGDNGFERNIHKRHRGLAGNHPADSGSFSLLSCRKMSTIRGT